MMITFLERCRQLCQYYIDSGIGAGSWQEKQEAFTFMDFVDVAHRYSREIEHSDINLLRLEKLFDRLPLFQPKQLIRILSV